MPEPRQHRAKDRSGLSERAYAAHAGVSRGCVQKARSSGRLVLHPDGSIDAAASDTRWVQATNPAMRRGLRSEVSSGLTYASARAEREALKVELCRIELQRRRGDVVDRARATALVFRLARQERDAWLSWPARAAPLVAAELGVDPHMMYAVLVDHVRQHLCELAYIVLNAEC